LLKGSKFISDWFVFDLGLLTTKSYLITPFTGINPTDMT
jgi:hypothetical protein